MEAFLSNNLLHGLLDSGSGVSCINYSYVKYLKHTFNSTDTNVIRVFNGSQYMSAGTADCELDFGTFKMYLKRVHVIKDLKYDFLIGMNHIKSLEIIKDGPSMKIKLNGHLIHTNYYQNQFFLVNNLEIPGDSVVYAPVYARFELPNNDLYISGRSDLPSKYGNIAIFDSTCQGHSPKVLIVNQSSTPINLPKNLLIGSTSGVNDINLLIECKDKKSETTRHEKFLREREKKFKVVKEPDVIFGDKLDSKQKAKIKKVLKDNHESFAYDKFDCGLARGFRYGIQLEDPKANFFVPPRRISPAKLPEVKAQLQNELKHGLISTISSKFNHPLVLVRKPDGSLRICSDLRKLNSKMEVQRYPIPTIDSILSNLGKVLAGCEKSDVFIASFDIIQAYRSLEVDDASKEMLAFSVEESMYTHERMAFGLADAPATFSFMMRKVLNEVPNTFNYLDDVILVARGFDEFTSSLDCLLKTLLNFGILLKSSKCAIGLDKLPFLGHLITTTGIRIQPEKISAIQSLRPPSDKDQLRSQLGMFNFHHSAVPNLYLILEPLFKLLKLHERFEWRKEHQKAFNDAKAALITANERVHRDGSLPLILSVDSSNTGCGAVLYQARNEELEPLAYFSKVFSSAEQKLPIRTRELIGIAKATKHWESYLIGESFCVLNDHHSLRWLQSTSVDGLCIRSRNILWYLSHFDFKFSHIRGTDPKNKIADCLSRASTFVGLDISEEDDYDPGDDFRDINFLEINHMDNNSIFEPEILNMLENFFDIKDFKAKQLEDAQISKRVKSGDYCIQDKLVLARDGRIPIPNVSAHSVINFVHVRKSHLGMNKLKLFLDKYFIIRNFNERATEVINSCIGCKETKSWPKLQPESQIKPDMTQLPMEKWFVDIIDFGQKSESGMRYGLTMLDDLTRYLDCVPLPDKSQASCSRGLITLIGRWGCPDHVVTDNGAEFIHETSKLLESVFQIHHSKISPYNPRSNLVERAHRAMKTLFQLHKVELANWDQWLPIILLGYNSTLHSALPSMSPSEALFLRRPKDVLTLSLKNLRQNWLAKFPELKSFEILAHHAAERKLDAIELATHVPKILREGDQVLVYRPLPFGASKKLYNPWSGLCTVKEKTSPGVYRLQCNTTNRRFKRNVRFIRKLESITPPTAKRDNDVGEQPTEENEIDVDSQEASANEDQPPVLPPKLSTRRGRVITRPKRYLD